MNIVGRSPSAPCPPVGGDPVANKQASTSPLRGEPPVGAGQTRLRRGRGSGRALAALPPQGPCPPSPDRRRACGGSEKLYCLRAVPGVSRRCSGCCAGRCASRHRDTPCTGPSYVARGAFRIFVSSPGCAWLVFTQEIH